MPRSTSGATPMQSGSSSNALTRCARSKARARQAAARADWPDAYAALKALDSSTFAAVDIDLFADAAWWTSRLDESIALRQRAYAAFAASDENLRAASAAWFLWFDHRFKGDLAIASGWLTRAARHVAHAPESLEAAFVLLAAAEVACGGCEFEVARERAEEALEHGRRLRNPDVIAVAMTTLGDCAIAAGESAAGLAILDDAMCSVIVGELTPLCMGIVYCSVIASCFAVADLGRATEWTNAAISWCDSVPNGSPYHGICRVHRVEVTTLLGAWPQAAIDARRACDELTALSPAAAGESYYAMGEVHRRRGELALAEAAFVQAHDLGREPQPGLALLRLQQARPEDARPLLRIEASTFSRARLPRSLLLAAQVEVAIELGDVDRAHAAVEALQALATDAPQQRGRCLRRSRARVSSPRDRRCRERVWRRESRRHAFRDLRLPYEAALARVVHGRAARAAGDEAGSRLELEAARRAFLELGATYDAARVELMLQPAAKRAGGLTERELEVLVLLAAGKTNREIAREMYLSEHTVARHLQNMFAKLDVSSRAGATAYAFRHELV